MPERINGGVFNDEVVTGLLRHFVITGADFSGAQDSEGRPIHGSAAEIIFQEITNRATVVIMNPLSQVNRGMSFALESNRASWTLAELQALINGLGNDVGVDHLDLSGVLIEEVPYDFTVGASMKFTDLIDTPNSYTGAAEDALQVKITEDGIEFVNTIGDGNYTILSSDTTVEKNQQYMITSNITVTLPDINTLSVGDQIIFVKSVPVIATIVTIAPSQEINTDKGIDTAITYDSTENLIFAFDGTYWSLQIGSKI